MSNQLNDLVCDELRNNLDYPLRLRCKNCLNDELHKSLNFQLFWNLRIYLDLELRYKLSYRFRKEFEN